MKSRRCGPHVSLCLLLALGCGDADATTDTVTDTSASTGTTGATTRTTDVTGASSDIGDTSTGTPATTAESTASPTDTGAMADGSSSGGGMHSAGCGNGSAATGETNRTLMIQGVQRSFIVDAPATIDPEAPLALAFVFHGNGGSGQGIQSMGLQNVPGAQDQAVFVFPDGMQYMDFGIGWNGTCGEYDMEFFDTLVSTLSDEYCIDDSRIFAAGFSWGGDMCESLACCRGDVVRAIAPASGPEFYPFDCQDSDRPAVRMTYATNDAYPPDLFAQTIEFYRTEFGCAATSTAVDPEPCIAYDDCAKPLIACEYEGLGHAWPGDWAEQTWAFFSQF